MLHVTCDSMLGYIQIELSWVARGCGGHACWGFTYSWSAPWPVILLSLAGPILTSFLLEFYRSVRPQEPSCPGGAPSDRL